MGKVADLQGKTVDETIHNTREVLCTGRGSPLILEDASLFCRRDASQGNSLREHDALVLDTLWIVLRRIPRNEQCVLLMSATEDLHKQLSWCPGFSELFPKKSVLQLEHYTREEFVIMLNVACGYRRVALTPEAKQTAPGSLELARESPTFGCTTVRDFVRQGEYRA